MGVAEEELTDDFNSDEVVDCIGEFVNQLIGGTRATIQKRNGLVAFNNQPKAICLKNSVSLTIDGLEIAESQCRRVSFRIEDHPFYVELFMEEKSFIPMEPISKPTETS